MPRPLTPPSLNPAIQLSSEKIGPAANFAEALANQRTRLKLAARLGKPNLSDDEAQRVGDCIAGWCLTMKSNHGTTVGSTKAALTDLIRVLGKALRTRKLRDQKNAEQVMLQLTSPTSAIDNEARKQLDSLGPNPTPEIVIQRAGTIIASYSSHERVYPEREVWRLFCGYLGNIFDDLSVQIFTDASDYRQKRRTFALAVMDAVGIEHSDYDSHPNRLDELLSAEAPSL
jgi:hypothetical protein